MSPSDQVHFLLKLYYRWTLSVPVFVGALFIMCWWLPGCDPLGLSIMLWGAWWGRGHNGQQCVVVSHWCCARFIVVPFCLFLCCIGNLLRGVLALFVGSLEGPKGHNGSQAPGGHSHIIKMISLRQGVLGRESPPTPPEVFGLVIAMLRYSFPPELGSFKN